jgi:hypothetical protein
MAVTSTAMTTKTGYAGSFLAPFYRYRTTPAVAMGLRAVAGARLSTLA